MKYGKPIFGIIALILALSVSCMNTGKPSGETADIKDTLDTGNFTGVKRYMYAGKLIKEVTFKNGIKEGLCKNYYDDGRLKSTIVYSNNLKVDTSRWYYPEGMVYRETPYKNNLVNGIQRKFYKSGRIQAEIPYSMGLRLPGLKEYFESGSKVKGMPSISYDLSDKYYETNGVVKILIKLSNGSKNVKFYRGTLSNGAFDPSKCREITISSGMGYLELKADDSKGKGYIDIIGVYRTRFGNKEILTKRIKLPHNNLI